MNLARMEQLAYDLRGLRGDAELAEMKRLARLTGASMMRAPGSGVVPSGGGGSGTITHITSTGGTVTITGPTGPTTNLEINNQFTTEVSAPDYKATGLTGAANVSRYVGAVSGAAPASGTFQVGDWVEDRTGGFWCCTVAGTPGTWVQVGGSHGAEYVNTFNCTNNANNTPVTGWTAIGTDTDNYGTALNSTGALTVPAGLGGRYLLTLTALFPAAAYTLMFIVFSGLPPAGTINPQDRKQLAFTNAIQGYNISWTGHLAGGASLQPIYFQVSGGTVNSVTTDLGITCISRDGT